MSQAWDPERYAEYARFVSDLGLPVVDLLDPQPGEQILDIGCGDGVLTERLVAAGSHVVAIDSSPEQIWASLKRGLDARIVDAAHLDFDGCFDAVFSNAALHWITTPEPVISGIWRALKPGGRFVGELGGSGCVASVRGRVRAGTRQTGDRCPSAGSLVFSNVRTIRRPAPRSGFQNRRQHHVPSAHSTDV